jgi:hypothetical protein
MLGCKISTKLCFNYYHLDEIRASWVDNTRESIKNVIYKKEKKKESDIK